MVAQTAAMRRTVLWPVVVAIAARIVWALLVPVHSMSDAAMYDAFARQIAAGRGYVFPDGTVTAYWPVGAGALYGGVYRLFGPSAAGVVGVNLLMGTALAGVTAALAGKRFGARAGLAAGLLVALWPVWIEFTTVLSSELPCVLFLMLALLVRVLDRPGPVARAALSTACLVASAYMRPIVLPLVPLLPVLDLLQHRDWRRTARELLGALVVTALLITPWALRNRAAFGHPVPISTNFGPNLWMGNNDRSNGGYMGLPTAGVPTNEVARDAYFKRQATNFIKAHPGRFVALCLARIRLSFDRETIGLAWNEEGVADAVKTPLKLLSTLYWYALALLGLAGFALLVERSWRQFFDPLTATVALVVAVAVLVVGMDRYHVVADPVLAIWAAVALERLRDRVRGASGSGALSTSQV